MERYLGEKIAKAVAAGGIALGSLAMSSSVTEASVETNPGYHQITLQSKSDEGMRYALAFAIGAPLLVTAIIIAASSDPRNWPK